MSTAAAGDQRYALVVIEREGFAPLYEVERHVAREPFAWETERGWTVDGLMWAQDDRFHAGPFTTEAAARARYPISGATRRRNGGAV